MVVGIIASEVVLPSTSIALLLPEEVLNIQKQYYFANFAVKLTSLQYACVLHN